MIDDDRPEGISRAAWIEAKRRFRAEKEKAGAASNAGGEKLSEDELALWAPETTLALFDPRRQNMP